MQKKWLSLKKALEEGVIAETDAISLFPEKRQMILSSHHTGLESNQHFSSVRSKLKYNPFILEKKTNGFNPGIYFVATTCMTRGTAQKASCESTRGLVLVGKTGYNHCPNLIYSCSNLCRSTHLNAYGIAITKEFFNLMPVELKNNNLDYWLASQVEYILNGEKCYGLEYVCNGNIVDCSIVEGGFTHQIIYKKPAIMEHFVRPVLYLSSDIAVCIEKDRILLDSSDKIDTIIS